MKTDLDKILSNDGPLTLAGVPEGFDSLILGDWAKGISSTIGSVPLLHIARDDVRLQVINDALKFFAPEVEVITFPAWDCLPYDRVSPNATVLANRMNCLSKLVNLPKDSDKPLIILTTINAALQRIPPQEMIKNSSFTAKVGDTVSEKALMTFLTTNGYGRVSQVHEPGEFAIRGGLIDIFPPTASSPIRMDLFGDELDGLRTFDALSQRTEEKISSITLLPVSEFTLEEASIKRFRQGYLEAFGTQLDEDPLYQAVSEGRRHGGAEHWLPLFHEQLETLFDYVPTASVSLDFQVDEAATTRFALIEDYYKARQEAQDKKSRLSQPYKPLKPTTLYLNNAEWEALIAPRNPRFLTPFQEPESDRCQSFTGKRGRDFSPERKLENHNVYDSLKIHVDELRKHKKRILFATYSLGAQDRLTAVLSDHGIGPVEATSTYKAALRHGKNTVSIIVLPLEHGFETKDLTIITETDVLGDRLIRKAKRSRKAENVINELSSLTPGDLVVHNTHGVARFAGLETLQVGGAAHDCLKLVYRDDDKLFLPVENIELLTRFGSEHATVMLDKLGGTGWKVRHARLKKRIRDMADELINIAATRSLRKGTVVGTPEGLYEEFCARFPYTETDDQARAIVDVQNDLAKGLPMDRLICGDVGFGKTEVALRSAFLAVMEGLQVAIVAPTTLLTRQHLITFSERFRGLPVNIIQLSRLVTAKDAKLGKQGLKSGHIDIVIGTHALLAKDIRFKNLGLLIIDEEQHFGVAHKEQLKKLKDNVHVLTLTATPIPRTLQLAMSGMRELSLIATPPVDRLAVRTYTLPFDEVVVKEALLREHYRGGQSFYVCPRVKDLDDAAEFLRDHLPDLKFITAHGQMPPRQIEDVMNAFYEGKYDVLLATTIIESGIDIPSVNTMIIHRADMYGLAQLYQLRGRVGRSKARAYCYLTIPPNKRLTKTAEQRLQVLQSLDTLGAGFTIASHDMDIRGAGNLLGQEQSGHIKEVGLEMYQQMLEEAVAEARAGQTGESVEDLTSWSPQINLGATVMIPEQYVPDLNLRMALYRRLGDVNTRDDMEAFAAELIDRFGPLPDEVKHLLTIIRVKAFCKSAGIERLEAGPKGATITFRNNRYANPAGLVEYITGQNINAKIRPDHKLVYLTKWPGVRERLKGGMQLAKNLARIAKAKG
jgi:transcription-repair coupling factor (superfamily II helicase)